MSYEAYLSEDRRLVILRLLAEDRDYSLNDSVLQTALEQIGHGVSRDKVRADIDWLAEQELVTRRIVREKIHVATLTQRGADVAAGLATCPGVKRPGPSE